MNDWKRFASSCKQVLGGLLATCLLAPVPLYAFDFSLLTWGDGTTMVNSGTVTPGFTGTASLFQLLTATPNAGNETTRLTFTLPAGQINGFGTTTIVSNVIAGPTPINATWANLGALAPQQFGSITISIGTAADPGPWSANNMFGETYNGETPGYSPFIDSGTATAQRIVVTFTYDGDFKALSSPSTAFTLTFHNAP
jgi:hypothetical protein